MTTAYLQRLSDFSGIAFVISSMLVMGMSQRLQDVTAPLRNRRAVLMALLVNFVLSPLWAIALCRLIPLQPAHADGLLLLGGAAGAPFLPKLAEVSGGSLSYSVTLMVLLMVGSIVFMPLALPLIVPSLHPDPWGMAQPLLLLLVVPLAIGFALGLADMAWVARLSGFAGRVSNLSFALFIVLMVGLNLELMAGTVGSFAIATFGLYVLGMVGAGYLLGGADRSTRVVFALGAGQRNIVAALVVAGTGAGDPAVTVMVLLASVTGMVLLLVFARLMRAGAPA